MKIQRVAILNPVLTGSTGKIAVALLKYLLKQNIEAVLCYGRGAKIGKEGYFLMESKWEFLLHVAMSRIFGFQGKYSTFATKRLIKKFRREKIDTIFAVLLHGYYLNERLLFEYIASDNIRLVYLMADEYPFLGKCALANGCKRYLIGCGKCPQKKEYPASLLMDRSASVWKMKLNAYNNIEKIAFVAPAFVVNNALKTPLMQGKSIVEQDEAVDLQMFCPRDTVALRDKLDISKDKIIITCVAPYPFERKGGQYFIQLAQSFYNDDRFIFVHVGCRKNSVKAFKNYIPIGYINDENELAEYFSLGDIFVFPSLDDTMPNACLDALGCGTPLLCFDISGMPYLADKTIGTFVEPRNVGAMAEVIQRLRHKDQSIIDLCRNYALLRYDARKYNQRLINIAESL